MHEVGEIVELVGVDDQGLGEIVAKEPLIVERLQPHQVGARDGLLLRPPPERDAPGVVLSPPAMLQRSKPSIQVGDLAPDFTLPDQRGERFTLSEALARGPVVVFFYQKDETAVCTLEACSFRDAHEDFVAQGATVVGISSDGVESHRRFSSRHGLNYPILADVDGVVRRSFGVPRGLFGFSDGRVTYVIDRGGAVRMRFAGTLKSSEHMLEALAMVRRL